MALNIDDELNLPLSEFVKLPTTVDFQVLNTERFKIFAKSRPYIRLGTEFENGYIVSQPGQRFQYYRPDYKCDERSILLPDLKENSPGI